MTTTNLAPFGAPHRWLELDDCTLPCWRFGSGPDLVLVHGWPIDSRTWRDIVPRLRDRFTCHLIDLPGAGQSKWGRETAIGLAENARTLREAIDQMGLERYGLVAHDSGAVFARYVAAGDPERVAALVCGNTEIPGHHPWQLKLFGVLEKVPGAVPLVMGSTMKLGPLRRSSFGIGACFVDRSLCDGEFYDLFVQPLLTDRKVMAGTLRLGQNLDISVVHGLREAHGRIQAPTRLIWGVTDPWFPLEKAKAMPAQFGGPCDLVTIDPGALFAHEEFPARFVELALPVLEAGLGLTDRRRAVGS